MNWREQYNHVSQQILTSFKSYWEKLPLRKVAAYAGLAVGAIVLLCVLVFLFLPGAYLDGFIKGRITSALAEAYPAYSIRISGVHYSVWENRLECDSVVLMKIDSSSSFRVAKFSLSGIGRMQLLWGGGVGPGNLAGSRAEAQGIVLIFTEEQYKLRCEKLRVSVPDSEIVVEGLELHPLVDDAQFFGGSNFRRTRFNLVIPRCSVMGSAFVGLLEGKTRSARSAQFRDAFLDVLINKDKPLAKDSSSPVMPNEMLSSIKGTLQVDSLSFLNGRLKYGERFTDGFKPGLITLDNMQVLARGITNHGDHGAAVVIHARGNFMKAGTMDVRMSIPVASREFSFQYSGSLSNMDLTALNPWLEPAEQMRVKTGVLQTATFDINVASGQASGNVQAVYRDLALAAINKKTGSEKGFFDLITSFIGKNFKLRGTNVSDKPGSMKIGAVKYARKRAEFFLEFSWLALRTGVGDVVGF